MVVALPDYLVAGGDVVRADVEPLRGEVLTHRALKS